MIPYDFEYHRPTTLSEALQLYESLDKEGKEPIYYSGGTEMITFARINLVQTKAVIDIKTIQECRMSGFHDESLITGSGLSLTAIEEENHFPLLRMTSREIADRTARNKITIGGNLCGRIFYREAVLPFLLTESKVLIGDRTGVKIKQAMDIFNGVLKLKKGELLVQALTTKADVLLPYYHIKRRQQWETGYPLVTAAALKKEGQIRTAFSGVCPFPFRSLEMEQVLNNKELSTEKRIEQALRMVPQLVLNDTEGSAQYRLVVLKTILKDILVELGGE